MANPATTSYASPAGAGPVTRPATLTLAYFGALAAGLFTTVGSVLLIAQATDVATKQVAQDLGTDSSDLPAGALTDVVNEAADKLHTRGIVGVVFGILVVLFALAVRNAAMWARIVLTVALVIGIFVDLVTARDIAPAATKALDIVALLLSIVVIVVSFMPANGRYAKARKSAQPA